MLESPTDPFEWDNSKSPFFKALSALAESQEEKPEKYLTFSSDGSYGAAFSTLETGRAVEICAEKERYVVAILGAPGICVPGVSACQIILISPDGKFLDMVACHINSRYGDVGVNSITPSTADGAQLIFTFCTRGSGWHNWHEITYRGKTYSFSEDEDEQPSVWDKKGLCRVKIAKNRFVVLFPELKEK